MQYGRHTRRNHLSPLYLKRGTFVLKSISVTSLTLKMLFKSFHEYIHVGANTLVFAKKNPG
jgi:hypothetical protein